MKRIILTILASVALMGCQKEERTQTQQNKKNCTCGVIANDGVTNGCYWLEIRNDCTGNKKKFCFDQDIWFENHVGDNICINNAQSW